MSTGAPAPGNGTPFRAIISVVETAMFAVAVAFAGIHHGHFANPLVVIPTLTGFLAHAINHPAGGSPI
jgi:hypothetical protein